MDGLCQRPGKEYLNSKKQIVQGFLSDIKPGTVWDLGANTGFFSQLCNDIDINVVSLDSDPACIERNYLQCKQQPNTRIMPLLTDLANPGSSFGWANSERMSLIERASGETVLALALVHHLALTNCVPLEKIADFLSQLCSNLIIEFVPKDDPQAQKLLATREDIFTDYNQSSFENEFRKYFDINYRKAVPNSKRSIYFMKKKAS